MLEHKKARLPAKKQEQEKLWENGGNSWLACQGGRRLHTPIHAQYIPRWDELEHPKLIAKLKGEEGWQQMGGDVWKPCQCPQRTCR